MQSLDASVWFVPGTEEELAEGNLWRHASTGMRGCGGEQRPAAIGYRSLIVVG